MRKQLVWLFAACILLSGCKAPIYKSCVYIDKQGKIIYRRETEKPDFCPPYGLGWVAFEENGKWGFLDNKGQTVIPPIYDNVGNFQSGYAVVYKGKNQIYITKQGMEIAPPEQGNSWTENDLYEKQTSTKMRNLAFESWSAVPDGNDLVRIKQNGMWGVYDTKTDKMIIQPQYENLHSFKGNLAAAKVDGLWGFTDETGKFVIKPQFDYPYANNSGTVYTFVEGLASVKKGNWWGYIDTTGLFVILPRFSAVTNFSDGAAAVTQGAIEKDDRHGLQKFFNPRKPLYGYINKKGEFITPQIYRRAEPFKGGIALVGFDDE